MAKDIPFQLNPANFMQTAANDATQIVAAALQAGVVSDLEDAEIVFDAWTERIFEKLSEQVKLDNASLKEAFDNAPEKTYGKKGSNKQANVAPGESKFFSGKHANETVAQVYETDPDYLEWYVGQSNPKMKFMQDKINEYKEKVQAGV